MIFSLISSQNKFEGKQMKKIFLFTLGLLLAGCGQNSHEIQQERENIEKEVKGNFIRHNDDFTSLKYYFKFNHIKEVRLSDNELFIKYIKNFHESGDVKEIKSGEVISPDMIAALRLDTISGNDMLRLKQYLLSIKSDRIQVVESYDEKVGGNIKFFDIRYEGYVPYMNFYYRMFDRNLDFTANSLYTVPTQEGSSGGILSKYVIWYYKMR